MYEAAVKLIKKGKAYVSDLSADEIREYRGTLTEPGKEDPAGSRSVEENLALFEDMKNGKFADGEKVLRARIDNDIFKHQYERSDSLPCSTHDAPQYRRSMVYLSDV